MITTSAQWFFFDKFSPKFNMKNMILTYTKDFSWEKMTQNDQILIFDFWFFFFKSPDFYDKFQYVAKNIERLLFFILSYLECSQIWLNYFWMITTLATLQNWQRAIPLTLTPSLPSPPPFTLSWRIWSLVCWHVSKQRSLGGLILGETNIF